MAPSSMGGTVYFAVARSSSKLYSITHQSPIVVFEHPDAAAFVAALPKERRALYEEVED